MKLDSLASLHGFVYDMHFVLDACNREFSDVSYTFTYDLRKSIRVTSVTFRLACRYLYYKEVFPDRLCVCDTLNLFKEHCGRGLLFVRWSIRQDAVEGESVYFLTLWY